MGAYWKPISGIQEPIPIRRFQGVYKPDDEGFDLSDGLFTELINFSPDQYPAITTRAGYTVIGTFGNGAVVGLMAWKDQELHAVFSDGSWRKYDGTTWTILATGLNTAADWSYCNFQGNLPEINLIAANGVDAVKRYNGTSVQNLTNAPAGANYITTQSNRLYCAVGNIVNFCALNVPTDWSTVDDAGQVGYQTTNGETINGLNGGYQHVTAFKPSSISELYGTGPTNYTFPPAASDIGAASNKAVTIKDDVLSFASRDGLYRYSGGVRPLKDFSIPVNNYVLGANPAHLSKCVSESDGKYIYYAIPFESATQNNLIIQYDPVHQGFYTWDNIAVTQMLRIGANLYFGDATGRVLRVGGTTDNGSPITATAVSKPFTAASISRKSHWFKLWVVASISTGASLSIYVSPDAEGSNWILAKTLTTDTDIQYKEILIPTNSIANANAVRIKLVATGVVTVHEITRQVRELPMRR